MPSFESFPLWVNLTAFATAAVVVWFAGVRLEAVVKTISTRTGLGTAFGGLVLLALATSLPELATTVTGAVLGNGALLMNNLLGGVMMQTAVLAVADCTLRRGALTYFAPRFALLIGGVSLVLLLGVAMVVMTAGDSIAVAGVGIGTTTIFVVHLTLVYFTYRSREHPRWQPTEQKPGERSTAPLEEEQPDENTQASSLRTEWLVFAGCSLAILVAGWLIMTSAEALTKQSGLSASFIGATLVALATSLPELSTTLAAMRRGHHEMAIANIFGSNLWDVSFLFVGDLFFRSGPLLASASRQAMFTASLGLVMTCVYLWGMLERQDRTIGKAGLDSVVVLALYLAGLAMLYTMR